jgi:hypothetical protein
MKFKVEEVEQLTLTVGNTPGILADLCAHLSEHEIGLWAITALESSEGGKVRLVPNRPEQARKALADAGVEFTSARCLAVQIPNHPGSFAGIARILSVAGINIDYIYSSTVPQSAAAFGIFGVSDLDRALKLRWEI